MYRIGYIDDEPKYFDKFKKKLQRRFEDIDLILIDGCKTKEEFVEKIYEQQIDVLLVDYKMAQTFGFNGSTLINYINDQIRDLVCFILTAVDRDSVSDGLVSYRDIQSKSVFDTEGDDEERLKELENFVSVLRESADVFRTRRDLKKEQYLELFEKRKLGQLSLQEEEEYLRLYRVLSSYGMVEKLPQNVLKSKFEEDLENLLQAGKAILDKHEK